MPVNLLSDVDVVAISIVDKGANRKKFYLRKSQEVAIDHQDEFTLPSPHRLLKEDGEWSAVYCVVAEPGWRENPGQGAADARVDDEWASPDEIRRAAHKFMKNGALVNKMHETLEPYGQIVENFVAQTDFNVGMEVIKAGSWVVGIEPSEEGRAKIEAGEFTGISIQGSGLRKLVEKKDPGNRGDSKKCPSCNGTVAQSRTTCQNCSHSFSKVSSRVYPSLERAPGKKDNWVEQTGGLPDYIERIAKHLHYEKGMTISRAIATAVSRSKVLCATSKDPAVKQKACKAVAEWEAKKAKAKVSKSPDNVETIEKMLEAGVLADQEGTLTSMQDPESQGWLRAIGKALGITKDDLEKCCEDGSCENCNHEKEKNVADTSATDEKLAKLEETVTKSSQQVESLANRIADIAQALASKKDEEKDEEKDVKKQQEDLSKQLDNVEESLGTIRDAVSKLAAGRSSQEVTHQQVTKNDGHPLSGVLFD
jgi:hypothetical protein